MLQNQGVTRKMWVSWNAWSCYLPFFIFVGRQRQDRKGCVRRGGEQGLNAWKPFRNNNVVKMSFSFASRRFHDAKASYLPSFLDERCAPQQPHFYVRLHKTDPVMCRHIEQLQHVIFYCAMYPVVYRKCCVRVLRNGRVHSISVCG